MEGFKGKKIPQIHVNEHLLDDICFHKSIPFFSGTSSTTRKHNLSLRSAFCSQSAVYPWSAVTAVCSPQSAFYTDRYCKYFLMYQSILKLSIHNSHISHYCMSYFEKIAHMSVVWAYMYLCGFASLYVRMFVARANKVEGTLSSCVGTNEILASNC